MRVLVCGGRDFSDTTLLYRTLDDLRNCEIVDCVIEGDARGADRIAGYWAKKNRIDLRLFPADWSLGKKAGPVRNQKMLDEGKPDLVLAFPTEKSRGTWDMVRRAKDAGVEVRIMGNQPLQRRSRMPRPFEKGEYLSGHDVETLADWLRENADPNIKITPDYTLGDLANDLGEISGGMWSDGIDAMGEDA